MFKNEDKEHINCDNWSQYKTTINNLISNGQYLQAIDHCKNALLNFNEKAEILHLMGITFSALKQWDNAIECIQVAIGHYPISPHLYFCLGEAYINKEELSLALQSFLKGWDLGQSWISPSDASYANLTISKLCLKMNNIGGWYDHLKIAEQISPSIDGDVDDKLITLSKVRDNKEILYSELFKDNIINPDYRAWWIKNSPRESDFKNMREVVKLFSYKPLISIILPVYNTPVKFLTECINSIISQIYTNWELCISDDASSDPEVREVLENFKKREPRINIHYRKNNGHISRATNSAIKIATGEFLAFVDHDDVLTPDALYEMVLLLNKQRDLDMIYSDEDKIDLSGNLNVPFFKPEWSPDSLLTKMYTCHLSIYRKSIIDDIGGLRVGFEGSQDWDLMLRFSEKTQKIAHIPKILYHWRMHEDSTAYGNAKPYAHLASKRAIEEALIRRNEIGEAVEPPGYSGIYNIRYKIKEYKKVSIIILTKDCGKLLDNCLKSIFNKTVYPNYEILLIDNDSKEQKTQKIIDKWKKKTNNFNTLRLVDPFNYALLNNEAVRNCDGDYLLFLNNDIEVINEDWLNALVEQAQRPSIGAVGPLLLFSDQTIQHAGVIMGLGGSAGHAYYRMTSNIPGYFGNLISQSNVSAVTGACLMCRREVFNQVGGFDEEMTVSYNDIDLCLKMIDVGYKNIYTPCAKLYHHESQTRGYEDTPEKKARLEREAEILKIRWQKYIDNDPCYSPHLTRSAQDYRLRI